MTFMPMTGKIDCNEYCIGFNRSFGLGLTFFNLRLFLACLRLDSQAWLEICLYYYNSSVICRKTLQFVSSVMSGRSNCLSDSLYEPLKFYVLAIFSPWFKIFHGAGVVGTKV